MLLANSAVQSLKAGSKTKLQGRIEKISEHSYIKLIPEHMGLAHTERKTVIFAYTGHIDGQDDCR
jgi:hypothetical protein